MIIEESGMRFPIEEENLLYRIETSNLYSSIKEGVKVAEFLQINNQYCYIFEAKTTSPNPNNRKNGNDLKFDLFIDEIKDKFVNTFSIYIANRLKRFSEASYSEMPAPFQATQLSTLNFKFILIIKDHELDWLIPVNDELKKRIKGFLKSWSINETNLKVLNQNLARELHYIL